MYTACFSGYRGDKFGFSLEEPGERLESLNAALRRAIRRAALEGYTSFYCGCAWGFDILAGEAVLSLLEELPELRLLCAVPFAGQADSFSRSWKRRHRHLLQSAYEIEVLCQTYTRECYLARNRYMVERASLLICYYDGKPGGTAHTVGYAKKRGLSLMNLAQVKEEGKRDEGEA